MALSGLLEILGPVDLYNHSNSSNEKLPQQIGEDGPCTNQRGKAAQTKFVQHLCRRYILPDIKPVGRVLADLTSSTVKTAVACLGLPRLGSKNAWLFVAGV